MLPTGCINGSPHCNGKMGTNIAEQSASKFSGVMDEQGSTFQISALHSGNDGSDGAQGNVHRRSAHRDTVLEGMRGIQRTACASE
jgi:hypothetical protein